MRNQNNDTYDLYIAAINNNADRIRELLGLGVNPNDVSQRSGHSALHGASFWGHVDSVNILLENGADPQMRCDVSIFGYEGIQKTVLEVCQEAGQKNRDQVSTLLGTIPDRRIEEINNRIEQYKKEHAASGPETKDFLLEVGGNFASQEARGRNAKPALTNSGKNALKYIHDAIYHINICSLEAEKLNPASDEYKNVTDTASLLMQTIGACAHYIYHKSKLKDDPNHPEFIEANDCKEIVKNPSVTLWKSLSRFSRLQEYDPSFISEIEYHTKSDIIGGFICLPEMRLELDKMMTACRYLRRYDEYETAKDENFLPNISRLSGFFEDEYYAQHIEKALDEWSNNRDEHFTSVGSKERFLRDVMIIGEALRHSSPVMRERFDQDSVSRIVKARNILCHAEKGINRAAIEQILSGVSSIITDSRLGFDQLEQDMLSLRDGISEQQNIYRNPILKEDILYYGSDQVWTIKKPQDKKKNDKVFSKIVERFNKEVKNSDEELSLKLKTELKKDLEDRLKSLEGTPHAYLSKQGSEEIKLIKKRFIEKKFEEDLEKLQKEFIESWVNLNDPHTKSEEQRELRYKLENPQKKALKSLREFLKEHAEQYESILIKPSQENLTGKERKLLTSYPENKDKMQNWQKYSDEKNILENQKESELSESETLHRTQLLERTVALSKFCKDQMTKVQYYFGNGFGEQPNFSHEVLEFYQIMSGSAARGLLEHEHFQKLAPEQLKKIFKENLQPSRGYLSHIGIRLEGKAFAESLSRSDVFWENSTKTSEAISIMEDAIKIMELEDNHKKISVPSKSVGKTFCQKMVSKVDNHYTI